MYSTVVSQLKSKHNSAETSPPERMKYDNIANNGVPPVPPRHHPPIPTPRTISCQSAQQMSCKPSPTEQNLSLAVVQNLSAPDITVEGPKSLPVEFSPALVSVLSGTVVSEGTQLSQLTDTSISGAPRIGWVVAPPSTVPVRRHSVDSVPNRAMSSKPDAAAVGCFNFSSMLGMARKKTITAVRAMKKKVEPTPQFVPTTVPEENHYAVSSELLRELTTLEPSSSNGRYIVGKELMTELLAPPAPSAPPMNLFA